RHRHQILLKLTSLGLKESSTWGTKRRRREPDSAHTEATHCIPRHLRLNNSNKSTFLPPRAPASAVSPTRSSMHSTPTSINKSPAMQPQRPSSQTNIMPPP
ncbi:hypothetical protein DICSQDRAFT_74382, partial [Dichomitus squalens LYAD-421 SS1]